MIDKKFLHSWRFAMNKCSICSESLDSGSPGTCQATLIKLIYYYDV